MRTRYDRPAHTERNSMRALLDNYYVSDTVQDMRAAVWVNWRALKIQISKMAGVALLGWGIIWGAERMSLTPLVHDAALGLVGLLGLYGVHLLWDVISCLRNLARYYGWLWITQHNYYGMVINREKVLQWGIDRAARNTRRNHRRLPKAEARIKDGADASYIVNISKKYLDKSFYAFVNDGGVSFVGQMYDTRDFQHAYMVIRDRTVAEMKEMKEMRERGALKSGPA